jgi:hypothetical protein
MEDAMAGFEPVLTIDFGLVGYGREREPFRVRLDAGPLLDLVADAHAARRVYELMLITRPGDVWPWIEAVFEALPRWGRQRLAVEMPAHAEALEAGALPGPLPFVDVDRALRPRGDDDIPEQWAWGDVRGSPRVRDYVRGLLLMARTAVDGLPALDPLLAHIVGSVRDGSHAFDWLDRARFATGGRRRPPTQHVPTGFLHTLARVLRDGEIASVSYRGEGAWHVLRALACEQRRRAMATGHQPGHALHVSALSNLRPSNEAWGSAIWYFAEGLAVGDLHVEEANDFGRPLRELATCPYDVPGAPGRYIVSAVDAGELPGWSREAGEGHVLYTREAPMSRRAGMARIHDRRSPRGWQVLSFAPDACVYSYDKALVVVGATVGAAARERLARRIAQWQADGGEVIAWVEGDAGPFERAACRHVVRLDNGDGNAARCAKAQPMDHDAGAEAQATLRREARVEALLEGGRWIDVLLALEPPDWVAEAAARHWQSPDADHCWPLFVVATHGTPHLLADHVIDGDVDAAIDAAIRSCPDWEASR